MNTETETAAPPPETNQVSNIQPVDFSSEAKKLHRKIAKLPKPLRDLINSSLDDGLPARQIIQKLETSTTLLPYPITEVDISRWKNSGYQRYLAHQDHLDSIEASREAALEMVRTSNNLSLPQATLQVIASQCFEILAEFSTAAVKQKLAEDPLKYTSFLHVFARLTREMVHLEKFQDARAAAQAQKSDPNRDKEAEATEFWTRHTRHLFNRKDPHRIKTTPSQPAAPISESEIAPSSSNTALSLAPSSPLSPSSPLPSRPCRAETPVSPRMVSLSASGGEGQGEVVPSHASRITHHDPTPDPQPSSPIPPNNPQIHQSMNPVSEHCLDCHHPLPPLTAESKRPFERCQICNVTLPPPGTCTGPSADKCHHCGVTLPLRLPNGRRPKPTCHNCGAHLGRELDEDAEKYAQE